MRLPVEVWALGIARAVADGSEDPYCRVGCVLVSSERIVLATGYNGTPAGSTVNLADREERRPYMIHAEANALRYTDPRHARRGLLAVTHQPCAACVNLASAYGVATIVFSEPPADPERYPIGPAAAIAERAGIELQQRGGPR